MSSLPQALVIRPLTRTDLRAIVALHRAVFSSTAISQLGLAATRRYVLSLLAAAPGSSGLCAVEGENIHGYCFLSAEPSPEVIFLRRNMVLLVGLIVLQPWLLMRPLIRLRIRSGWEMMRFFRQRGGFRPADAGEKEAAVTPNRHAQLFLHYLAVNSRCRGRGLGAALLAAAENLARTQGYPELRLSVYLDNHRAIHLYERAGWQRLREDGEWRGFMFKNLLPYQTIASHEKNRAQPDFSVPL